MRTDKWLKKFEPRSIQERLFCFDDYDDDDDTGGGSDILSSLLSDSAAIGGNYVASLANENNATAAATYETASAPINSSDNFLYFGIALLAAVVLYVFAKAARG